MREPRALFETFSFRPDYYNIDESADAPINYFEHGPQNSRGFRTIKVWLALRQAGRAGYENMLRTTLADIEALPELVLRYGRLLDADMRSQSA